MSYLNIFSESDAVSYDLLLKKRPNSINIHTALSNHTGIVHVVEGGSIRGIYEFMSPHFKNIFHPVERNMSEMETVNCITAKQLFRILNFDAYDTWVLDVEGAEETILQVISLVLCNSRMRM